MSQSVATKKPTGWQVVLLMVEVARVELASKYVKYSATTGLVSCCTLRSAGSRRPALHDFPFGTLWQGTYQTTYSAIRTTDAEGLQTLVLFRLWQEQCRCRRLQTKLVVLLVHVLSVLGVKAGVGRFDSFTNLIWAYNHGASGRISVSPHVFPTSGREDPRGCSLAFWDYGAMSPVRWSGCTA